MATGTRISIEYCQQWNYLPQAVRATEEILSEIGPDVAEWTLLPSKGGVFEVTVNGQLVYSKKQTQRHAEDGELLPLVRAAL